MSEPGPFGAVAILGLGLIGGSLALALRDVPGVAAIAGFDADPATLSQALARGIVDSGAMELEAVLRGADLVVIATPVGAMEGLLRRMAPALAPHAIVTDCASTKGEVVRWAQDYLLGHVARFVPAHPIAGSEASGLGAARADLFRGTRTILCPRAEGEPLALAQVSRLWERCGSQIVQMTPERHDAVFAAVSHLPQLLAYALMHTLARRPGASGLLDQGGAGFRDFTRLAGSHPVLWRDICLTNRTALLQELHTYQDELAEVTELLDAADGAALEQVFAKARQARERLR